MAAKMVSIGSAPNGHGRTPVLPADRHGLSCNKLFDAANRIPRLNSTPRNLGKTCYASGPYAGLQPSFLLAPSLRITGNEAWRNLVKDDAGEIPFIPQILSFSWVTVLWDIACGLLRLPATIWGLLTGKESTIREVEENVEKAAEYVKKTATKVEKTAEEVERVAEIVAEDADKVEAMVDKVAKASENMNEEIKETVGDVKDTMGSLKEATETMEKSAKELQNKDNDAPKTPPASTKSTPDVSKFSNVGHFELLLLLLGPFRMHTYPHSGLLIRYTIAIALTVLQVVFLRKNPAILPSPLLLQA